MKERPILFSAPMVRALLDGRKTQTRRIMKPQPEIGAHGTFHLPRYSCSSETAFREGAPYFGGHNFGKWYGDEGSDHLWVREAWRTYSSLDGIPPRNIEHGAGIQYEARGTNLAIGEVNNLCGMGKLRPSMFMPRWASRIQLEITGVRAERLQDISEDDARHEGCLTEEAISGYDKSTIHIPKEIPDGNGYICWDDCKEWYAYLWESINGNGSWEINPWVWVIEFKVVKP